MPCFALMSMGELGEGQGAFCAKKIVTRKGVIGSGE
jgi:hypothetical protein